MLPTGLYTLENLNRVKYVQIIVIILALALCGSFGFSALQVFGSVRRSEVALQHEICDEALLAREVVDVQRRSVQMQLPRGGGIERFAVTVSKLADSKGVAIESLTPEGMPNVSEITVGESKLGLWAANKVRIKGQADFTRVMALMNELMHSRMPVQLESYTFQSCDSDGSGRVSFEMFLTVYEKKTGVS